jgi:hypothetical protein
MNVNAPTALIAGASALGGFAAGRAWGSPQARFARMAGSTIAAPDAAGWVTDFLNAAYYRRDPAEREVDDLRLAFSIVTTAWYRKGPGRLRAGDVLAFHRAFGRHRFRTTERSGRGVLAREELLEGAASLFGPWFADGYADASRRGWGVVFPTPEDKAAYRPEVRLEQARLGALTPGTAPGREQTWHTYPPVAVPSVDGVVEALLATETWPDMASELGRFTPLRASSLPGQTFEIEVAAGTAAGRPVFTRGYVTITRLVTAEQPEELTGYVEELNDGLARFGRDEPPAVPPGATPLVAFDLTTHEGHFMGAGNNRLVLFEQDGQPYVRAAGTWDPMPWHLDQAYRRAGRDAQHAFWGQGPDERQSMLHQLARRVEQRAAATG